MSSTSVGLTDVGQQIHKAGSLHRYFHLTLTSGAVAASLAGKHLATLRQQFPQGFHVLVIHVSDMIPAKPAFRLFSDDSGLSWASRRLRSHMHLRFSWACFSTFLFYLIVLHNGHEHF
jgi:hypothetical protein